jgi:hypothetical protein
LLTQCSSAARSGRSRNSHFRSRAPFWLSLSRGQRSEPTRCRTPARLCVLLLAGGLVNTSAARCFAWPHTLLLWICLHEQAAPRNSSMFALMRWGLALAPPNCARVALRALQRLPWVARATLCMFRYGSGTGFSRVGAALASPAACMMFCEETDSVRIICSHDPTRSDWAGWPSATRCELGQARPGVRVWPLFCLRQR